MEALKALIFMIAVFLIISVPTLMVAQMMNEAKPHIDSFSEWVIDNGNF